MAALRTVTSAALVAGAVGSLGFMLRAGRHNNSLVLLSLFAIWVVSPFGVLLWANLRGKLTGVTPVIALGSLAIYGVAVLGLPVPKPGSVFLMVPAVSWLLMGILAFLSRKR